MIKSLVDKDRWLDLKNMPKKRAVKRRCKHCRTKLNSYNLNDYCHAHRAQGIKDNMDRLANIAYKKHLITKKYLERKKRENAKQCTLNRAT